MFGRVNFRKDEKKGEKIKSENFLEVVWLEGGGENDGGPECFLIGPTKKFSPQNGEKTWWVIWWVNDKNAHVQVTHEFQNVFF